MGTGETQEENMENLIKIFGNGLIEREPTWENETLNRATNANLSGCPDLSGCAGLEMPDLHGGDDCGTGSDNQNCEHGNLTFAEWILKHLDFSTQNQEKQGEKD